MKTLPHHFREKMQALLGEEFPAFEAALNAPQPVSIRTNPLKGPVLFGDEAPIPWCKYGRYLAERPKYVWDPLYHAGAYYSQEAASMILEQAIVPKPKLKVLDLCAAPGGKSSLILSLLSDDSLLVSNEMVSKRTAVLYENLVKWGYPNVVVTQNYTKDFLRYQSYFDIVVVDAPCSGEGMFRKDPGAIEQWSEGLVQQCSAIQKEILHIAVQALAPGGRLVYSTCTFEQAENEQNLQWIYENYPGLFSPVALPVKEEWGHVKVQVAAENGHLQEAYYAYPHRVKGEGLFIAALQKNADSGHRQLLSGSKGLQPISRKEKDAIATLVDTTQTGLQFYRQGDDIIALPVELERDMSHFIQHMRVRKAGVNIGNLKRDNLIPSHDMLMAGLFNSHVPKAELTLPQALDFMQRKPPVPDEDLPTGWVVFTYKSLPIGWGKNVGNRINAHYPAEWRVRKEPDFY